MVKTIFIVVFIGILLVGCTAPTPDPAAFQKMVEGTVAAQDTLAAQHTDTPEPTNTLAPTNTPKPTKTLSPTSTPTSLPETSIFTTFAKNLYTIVVTGNDTDALQLKTIEFLENPDRDITLLIQVKGDVTEASKGATLGYVMAVINKGLNEGLKVPDGLRNVVIEFFDTNDNYFSNYGVSWSNLRALISNEFSSNDLMSVVKVDVTGYK